MGRARFHISVPSFYKAVVLTLDGHDTFGAYPNLDSAGGASPPFGETSLNFLYGLVPSGARGTVGTQSPLHLDGGRAL